MNAGQALGLLAGLGAINALRGGRDGAGPRFKGLLDMIDGGGAGQSGDKFEGGGLLSMLGNLFAKPIEAQRNVERIAADTAATKALTEVLKESVTSAETPSVMDETPVTPKTSDQAIGGYQYPSMYRPMDRQVGLFQQGQSSVSPALDVGATDGRAELARLRMRRQEAVGNRPVRQDDMPAILSFGGGERMPQPYMPAPSAFSASGPSVAAMTPPSAPNQAVTAFNQAMATVPQMLQGTQIAEMYRDHLLNGGGGTFAQFTGAQ